MRRRRERRGWSEAALRAAGWDAADVEGRTLLANRAKFLATEVSLEVTEKVIQVDDLPTLVVPPLHIDGLLTHKGPPASGCGSKTVIVTFWSTAYAATSAGSSFACSASWPSCPTPTRFCTLI